jgi:hypothetical protein
MKSRITGFDQAIKKLDDLAQNAKNLSGPVPLADLFDDDFMAANTTFNSMQTMLDASDIEIKTEDDIKSPEWNAFVAKTTSFSSWQEMMKQGARAYALKKLKI